MTPSLQTDFERVLQTFSVIAGIESPLKRAFVLSKMAGDHGFSAAEFRHLFGIWQREQAQITAATAITDDKGAV